MPEHLSTRHPAGPELRAKLARVAAIATTSTNFNHGLHGQGE